jgi:hydroxymethylglutaryl-CoA reductase
MVEAAVGYLALPLGIATGFLIDGDTYDIPMATEEPSVIAAATYAATLTARAGGFTTTAGTTVTTGQVFLESCPADAIAHVEESRDRIAAAIRALTVAMEQRGGGLRGIDPYWLPENELLCIEFHLDVCDAMGANVVNAVGEAIRPLLEEITGGRSLMAIVTNAASQRIFGSTFRIPVERLSRAGTDGSEIARRIALAGEIAQENRNRAITHNKGVMNGVTALALATGNDTRALEAAAHSYASKSGRYVGLTTYRLDGAHLVGNLEMPVVIGSVGGAAEVHPTSRFARALMGDPDAVRLSRIAAALGLAQNFAALYALVTEGIQNGHMALHARRLANGSDRETDQ